MEAIQGKALEELDVLKHFILTLCWESIATGDLGLSGLTAVEGGTLLHKHWACSAVDRSVHWRGEHRRFRKMAGLCEANADRLFAEMFQV